MKIAVFTDGRPGHEKQTFGIVNALSGRISTEVSMIRVDGRFKGQVKAFSEFVLLYKKQKAAGKKFDIAIGTGSKTHLCILAAKFFSGAKALTCMTPERIFLPFFDLCFVPVHDIVPCRKNVMKTAGPPGINRNMGRHDRHSGLVLAGGTDERSHEWNSAEITKIIKNIIKNDSIEWTVSTSPRTPDNMDSGLAAICNDSGAAFRPFSSTPRGWLETMYDLSGTVWVTADSISMVYEALSAGCRVGVIPVKWKKKGGKFQRSLDFLLSEKKIVFYPEIPEINEKTETFDEAGRCAGEIIKRWLKNG